jgi:Fe-S oxidoreductase
MSRSRTVLLNGIKLEHLGKLKLDYEVLDSRCCGMAGPFGFEKMKYDISVKAGERVLLLKYFNR